MSGYLILMSLIVKLCIIEQVINIMVFASDKCSKSIRIWLWLIKKRCLHEPCCFVYVALLLCPKTQCAKAMLKSAGCRFWGLEALSGRKILLSEQHCLMGGMVVQWVALLPPWSLVESWAWVIVSVQFGMLSLLLYVCPLTSQNQSQW